MLFFFSLCPGVAGCNTSSVSYSNCDGVRSAGDIIYATQNRLAFA